MNTQKLKHFFIAKNKQEIPETRAHTPSGAITRITLIHPEYAKLSISELAELGYTVKKDNGK
jgi:hypothetical protein